MSAISHFASEFLGIVLKNRESDSRVTQCFICLVVFHFAPSHLLSGMRAEDDI